MRIGNTVQMISMNVLWVVLEGCGLLLALNLTITADQQAQNKQGDDRDDRQQESIVEPVDVLRHRSGGTLQTDLPGFGMAQGLRHRRSGGHRDASPAAQVYQNALATSSFPQSASSPKYRPVTRKLPEPERIVNHIRGKRRNGAGRGKTSFA